MPGAQSSAYLADWVDDLFYGGERGGGKSDFQLGYQESGALLHGKNHRGFMARKTYAELEELQARALDIFPESGATFRTHASSEYPFSNAWYWRNGASVKMRYIEAERDYGRYHGHSYTRISLDEVTEYESPAPLLKMYSTLRSPAGVHCSVRSTGNPGGRGHVWVSQRYVNAGLPYHPVTDSDTGLIRMFIPSRLSDNSRMANKEQYRRNIMAATAGNTALRKAWLSGDWNIVVGAFFDCWNERLILPASWRPSQHWTRFGAFDWGSAKPFAYALYAIADEDTYCKTAHGEQRIPRGAIICYKEWYGCKPNEPNTGLKLTAEQVADGIMRLERNEPKVAYRVADPSIWKVDGGPSIAERMYRYRADWNKNTERQALNFREADNSRVTGWDQMRHRMLGELLSADTDDEPVFGDPLLFYTESCRDSIRLIPAMQHDETRVEDIDTDSEDHIADRDRYACMSRPISLVPKPRPVPLHPLHVRNIFTELRV